MIRAAVVVLWIVVVFAGDRYLASHSTTPKPDETPRATACVAARELPVNHRVRATDVTCKSGAAPAPFIAQYIAAAVEIGAPLDANAVRPLPVIELGEGLVSVLLPLEDPRLPEVLNAGHQVDVICTGKPALEGLDVLAVQCPGATAADCAAILAIHRNARDLAGDLAACTTVIRAPKGP